GGKISSHNQLSAGVGNIPLGPVMNFGATLEPVRFRAGFGSPAASSLSSLTLLDGVLAFAGRGVLAALPVLPLKPAPPFFLPVDNDLTRSPNKFFVADNTTPDRAAIRLMALEWQKPVFARGAETRVSLRFLEKPNQATLRQPVARMSWSHYDPSNP